MIDKSQISEGINNIISQEMETITTLVQNNEQLIEYFKGQSLEMWQEVEPFCLALYFYIVKKHMSLSMQYKQKSSFQQKELEQLINQQKIQLNKMLSKVSLKEMLQQFLQNIQNPLKFLQEFKFKQYTIFMSKFGSEALLFFIQQNQMEELYLKKNEFINIQKISEVQNKEAYEVGQLYDILNNNINQHSILDEKFCFQALQTYQMKYQNLIEKLSKCDGNQLKNKLSFIQQDGKSFFYKKLKNDINQVSQMFLKKKFFNNNIDKGQINLNNNINFNLNHIMYQFHDPNDQISLIEIGITGSIVITAKKNNTLSCFILNQEIVISQETDEILQNETTQNSVQELQFVGHEESITSISIQYDEKYFLSGSIDSNIIYWSIRQQQQIAVYKIGNSAIWKVKFYEFGTYFASSNSKNLVFLWKTEKPIPLRIFQNHSCIVSQIEFSHDFTYIITSGTFDQQIKIWSIESGKQIFTLHFNQTSQQISCISLSPLNILVVGGRNGQISIWNLNTLQLICSQNILKSCNSNLKRNSIQGILFNLNGELLIVNTTSLIKCFSIENLIQQSSYNKLANMNVAGIIIDSSQEKIQKTLITAKNLLISISKSNFIN